MIDLHLHTTASDGRYTPGELVTRCAAAGLTVMAVTDHDTMAGIAEARTVAGGHGIDVVPGMEITAVENGGDIHMLAYFLDETDESLTEFLHSQQEARLQRVHAIGERLASLGLPIDVSPLLEQARITGRSLGRPQIAQAMIGAGHCRTMQEAFDGWLANGKPAFVSRSGPSPEQVIAIVHAHGGMISLAHPGRTRIDGRIAALCEAGLDAIEVYHPDHAAADVARYREMVGALNVLATGGSDYHGDPARSIEPGRAHLPAADWQRLVEARAAGV